MHPYSWLDGLLCMPAADVAASISIVQGDLLQVPLQDATVVYAYLLPQGGPARKPFACTSSSI
jgi:hypothetical protein